MCNEEGLFGAQKGARRCCDRLDFRSMETKVWARTWICVIACGNGLGIVTEKQQGGAASRALQEASL